MIKEWSKKSGIHLRFKCVCLFGLIGSMWIFRENLKCIVFSELIYSRLIVIFGYSSVVSHRCFTFNMKNRCEYCEKGFATPQALKIHIRNVHDGIKAFKCEICEKGFATPQTLNNPYSNCS